VEEAAKLLGKTWTLGPDRKRPDFLVTEGTQKFGLEVSEVFAGLQNRAGAVTKKKESETQKAVSNLQTEYENITNTPLRVRLLGDICTKNIAKVVPALVDEDFVSKPICHQAEIRLDHGFKVYVTKALRAEWFCVNDRVGWVNHDPKQRVVDAIKKKSEKLKQYKEAVGSDIHLLLVADRTFNSGRLMLKEGVALDTRGFRFVYFFSYPESVIVFDCTSNKE